MTADAARPRFSEAALAEYREILTRYPERRAALMPTLWLAQREFGWLSQPVQEYVAELMELPLAWVTSVVVLLHHVLEGAEGPLAPPALPQPVVRAPRRATSSAPRSSAGSASATASARADGRFSFEEVECLATAARRRCMQVNNAEYHENLDVARALALLDRLAARVARWASTIAIAAAKALFVILLIAAGDGASGVFFERKVSAHHPGPHRRQPRLHLRLRRARAHQHAGRRSDQVPAEGGRPARRAPTACCTPWRPCWPSCPPSSPSPSCRSATCSRSATASINLQAAALERRHPLRARHGVARRLRRRARPAGRRTTAGRCSAASAARRR